MSKDDSEVGERPVQDTSSPWEAVFLVAGTESSPRKHLELHAGQAKCP